MGDRRMVELRSEDGSLYIYSRWNGYKLPAICREAMQAARPRRGDTPYWRRIMVDQITKSARDAETGWGLLLKPNAEDEYNDNNVSIVCNEKAGTVDVIGGGKGEPETT